MIRTIFELSTAASPRSFNMRRGSVAICLQHGSITRLPCQIGTCGGYLSSPATGIMDVFRYNGP
jgi:hypothetical protein